MYTLDNHFKNYAYTVTLIGCGGTGGFVADGLARLLPPMVSLRLVDYDRVEERNLSRQNFFSSDLGKFKSEALADRLSREYLQPIAYVTSPIIKSQLFYPGIIISCVDNGLARQDIFNRLSQFSSLTPHYGYSMSTPRELQDENKKRTYLWWVDVGNGENYGQILIGNAIINDLAHRCFESDTNNCYLLPFPTIQSPELLTQLQPVHDCVDIAEQGPTINRVIASLTVEVVRRLITGTCSWMQLWLDLAAGRLNPVFATPETVASITHTKVKSLFYKRKEVS